ncbi:MAG TPA: hypothetical protein VF481_05890 [Novosphingobium sp.]
MNNSQDSVALAARRMQIEAALADYPHVSKESLGGLLHWFRREASSLDVAMLASNEAIAEPYRRFRADHIDRITAQDVMKGLAFAAAVGLVVLFIIWWAV